MNILIDVKNAVNKKIENQLISIKVIIIKDKLLLEYKGTFQSTIIDLITDVNFVSNKKYDVIFSIAILGKQIIKEKYSFVYIEDKEYQFDDGCISFKITEGCKTNQIKMVNNVNSENYQKYNYKINPLSVVRQENDKMTIFLNGTLYIVKGRLKEFVEQILYLDNYKVMINDLNKLDDINELISKGCIVCYGR